MESLAYFIVEKIGKFLIGKTWAETLVRMVIFIIVMWFILDTLFGVLFDVLF